MRISILPKTSPGRWSVGLIIPCIIWPLIHSAAGIEAHSNVDAAALFATIFMSILGTGSLVTGLISVIKRKERSILVFLVMIVALVVLFIVVMMNLDLAGY